jgi:hypothetical protein
MLVAVSCSWRTPQARGRVVTVVRLVALVAVLLERDVGVGVELELGV